MRTRRRGVGAEPRLDVGDVEHVVEPAAGLERGGQLDALERYLLLDLHDVCPAWGHAERFEIADTVV